jgi:hypothetical protein
MIKIVALTDLEKEEDQQEDDTSTLVTKEAQVCSIIQISFLLLIRRLFLRLQETIAVSEYMRALSLKQNGNPDFALGLFEDLLRTQVLSDVSLMNFRCLMNSKFIIFTEGSRR